MTAAAAIDAETAPPRQLCPLTERIVVRLPGERTLWIVAWALIPWLNAGANVLLGHEGTSAVWEQRHLLVVLNYVALSIAVFIALWGTARIADRLEHLGATTAGVLRRDSTAPFRGMNNAAGPVALSVAAAVAFGIAAFSRDGWAAAALRGVTWLIIGIAIWTFLWTYVCLQLGLDRLGREHLVPDAPSVDPDLGLRPLGDVAFTGLWMLMAALVPVVVTGLPDVVGFTLGIVVLGGGLLAFFLSLVRLHRQMAAAKTREVALARGLYAEAYQPVRGEPTLETLERQRNLLAAADSLEKRAGAIHEWPIDEGTWARVVTIATSVTAISVARLILNPLGL